MHKRYEQTLAVFAAALCLLCVVAQPAYEKLSIGDSLNGLMEETYLSAGWDQASYEPQVTQDASLITPTPSPEGVYMPHAGMLQTPQSSLTPTPAASIPPYVTPSSSPSSMLSPVPTPHIGLVQEVATPSIAPIAPVEPVAPIASAKPSPIPNNSPSRSGRYTVGQSYTMRITYYCSCSECTGKWAKYGKTASGVKPSAWYTVAHGSLPFGTLVEIDGNTYRVEDRGVYGDHIDIFVGNHQQALKLGLKKTEVKIIQLGNE